MGLRKAARSLVRINMMLIFVFESKHNGGNKEGCVCVCVLRVRQQVQFWIC